MMKRNLVKMFKVTLVDLDTFEEQEIGIRSPDPDMLPCVEDLEKWVRETDFNPPLKIKNPHVIRVKECRGYLTPAKANL
jgi:hypothetical protein